MAKDLRTIYMNGRFLTQEISGVQRYAHEIVHQFDQFLDTGEIPGDKYRIVLLTPARHLKFSPSFKHIEVLGFGQYGGQAWEQWELPFYAWNGLLFNPGNTAPLMSYLFRRKVVVTLHSLAFRYYPQAYSWAFRRWYNFLVPIILKKSAAVITVSGSEKEAILQAYPYAAERLHVIQNGGLSQKILHHLAEFPPFRLPLPKPYILFVGSLSEGKNLHGVLQALEILNRKEDISLVIVGASSRTFRELHYQIPDGLQKKVVFAGQLNRAEKIVPYYRNASCLVFPSFYEASSLPPLEAMACGCPVVASDIPALRERCGEAALYCDPHHPEDIARKTAQILNDENVRDRLVQAGYRQAEKYTWEACARETFRLLEDIFEQE